MLLVLILHLLSFIFLIITGFVSIYVGQINTAISISFIAFLQMALGFMLVQMSKATKNRKEE